MLNSQRKRSINMHNDSTQNRNIMTTEQRRAYDQMEKEPSEHAKKFFHMECYHLKKGLNNDN